MRTLSISEMVEGITPVIAVVMLIGMMIPFTRRMFSNPGLSGESSPRRLGFSLKDYPEYRYYIMDVPIEKVVELDATTPRALEVYKAISLWPGARLNDLWNAIGDIGVEVLEEALYQLQYNNYIRKEEVHYH